ncbi:MAG: tetratricopeptide repeat protein [Nitrospiraceae bacterium]
MPTTGARSCGMGSQIRDSFCSTFEPRVLAKEIRFSCSAKRIIRTGRTAQQWIDVALELEAHSPEEAREAYREALKLDPDRADALINLGRLYHEAEQWDNALQRSPGDRQAQFNLAVLFANTETPQ